MAALDSSALIHILSGTKQGNEIKEQFGYEAASITAISINEVLIGVHEKNKEEVLRFLQGFDILPFDARAAIKSVELERTLAKSGKPIGKLDLFIAAICIVHDVHLITTDKDFNNIKDLKVMLIP